MEFRVVRSDELPRWREFDQYCFQVPDADLDAWIQNAFQPETVRGLFSDDGEMLATLMLLPYQIYVEGARIPMGGIGSVASLPENRRGGYVGELLIRTIREMKEREMPLSSLFPFKQSFYRRYGWEVSSAWLELEIPVGLFKSARVTEGVIKRYLPGQADWREVATVYDRWAAPQRGYMVRATEFHWRTKVFAPWARWAPHVAVWRPSASAEPEGFLVYRFDKADDGSPILLAQQLVALTQHAWSALWGYVANHDSQVKWVGYRCRRDFPVWHMVENTSEVKMRVKSGWMLRLVDLKAAFEARPWPEDVAGSVTIGVRDDHAPWNGGTWRLTFEGGRAAVTAASVATPDLSADVQTWAQLYSSFVRPAAAAASGRLAVVDSRALWLLSRATEGDDFFFYEYF